MGERRNDVGWKFTVGIMIFIVTSILTIFFNHTYGVGYKAHIVAQDNTVVNARQDAEIKGMTEKLGDLKIGQNEIKTLLMDRGN